MRTMIRSVLCLGALAAGLGSAGCASVPLASPQQDLWARNLQPQPGAALVYIYRNESFGAAVRMTVLLDGAYVGDTGAKTYLMYQVGPGQHMLVSKAEKDEMLPFYAEPGRKYYVWQEVKMGAFSARSALHLVSDVQGMQDMAECKLVAPPAPAQPPGARPPS